MPRHTLSVIAIIVTSTAAFNFPARAQQPVPTSAPAQPKPEPIPVPQGVRRIENIAYRPGAGPLQSLDLYLPDKPDALPSTIAQGERLPLVVWVHTGNWKQGDKANCPAAPWAARGFVVASVNYRLSPGATLVDMVHDLKSAVRFLKSDAAKYSIDPDRIGIWGVSAGAHLAALAATTSDVPVFDAPEHATSPLHVQACCAWFGPMDLSAFKPGEKLTADIDAALAGPAGSIPEREPVAKKYSPLTYVSKDDPAFLFLHGDKNDTVPKQQTEAMAISLKSAGVDVTAHLIPDQGHGFRPKSEHDKYVATTESWFANKLELSTPKVPPAAPK